MDISLKIPQWKAKYGSVFILEIEEISIYYRTLTAWEVQSIIDLNQQKKASVDIEEATCLFGVLDPTPLPTFNKPGSITSLSDSIWRKSTLSNELAEETIESVRAWSRESIDKNYNLVMASIMCRLMPALDLSNLLELSTTKLLKLGAIIEKITEEKFLKGEMGQEKQKQNPIGNQVTDEMADRTSALLATALKRQKQKLKK
jgi:hypothetical protein